jgi:hypothetical protein
MLKSLHLRHLGLARELQVEWADRINLIVGDNGLGKTFLLDLAWWALTRTWAGPMALPAPGELKATISYTVRGATTTAKPVTSTFSPAEQAWPLKAVRPAMPGIVVYIRIDGGFSVWDPARNYWRTDPGRPPAYHFQSAEVWDGLSLNGVRVCEGLERDWVNWQEGRKPHFDALKAVLAVLSPPGEPITIGQPQRLLLGEGRDRPTLQIAGQTVPVALASSGVRRILALAYFLVWAWHEHQLAARLLGKTPEKRFVLLFDEPETHLHPRWQRTVLPSLLQAVATLRGPDGEAPQMLVATHAPLVAASLEPHFDPERDDLIHLGVRDGQVVAEQGGWATQGDATNWLVSEAFGLEQARSLEAERAIEAAEAWMRDEPLVRAGLDSQPAIHAALQRLLPAGDPFWPRWIVRTGQLPTGSEA